MALNEQEFLDLCEYRKSMVPQYEIRDHLPGFERMELMAMWRAHGTEKMRWALRELGLHTGWKFRMLAKILDGSANVNYVPEHIQQPAKPAAHKIVRSQDNNEPIASNEETREKLGELLRKMRSEG